MTDETLWATGIADEFIRMAEICATCGGRGTIECAIEGPDSNGQYDVQEFPCPDCLR